MAVTSLGRSTDTGSGRPEVAILNASLILLGSSLMLFTITFHLAQLLEIPMTLASWNASEPMAEMATCPENTTNGRPSGGHLAWDDHICRTGSRGDEDDTGQARHTGVALHHMARTLFVPWEDELEVRQFLNSTKDR